jgi:hypothetical protein
VASKPAAIELPRNTAAPLAGASERLRDVPGFPRRRGRPATRGQSEDVAAAAAVSPASVAARLLDVDAAATYLGVSPWTIRDLEAAGTLKRVRVPLRGGELRKLLFDRADLDRLIEVWKF